MSENFVGDEHILHDALKGYTKWKRDCNTIGRLMLSSLD